MSVLDLFSSLGDASHPVSDNGFVDSSLSMLDETSLWNSRSFLLRPRSIWAEDTFVECDTCPRHPMGDHGSSALPCNALCTTAVAVQNDAACRRNVPPRDSTSHEISTDDRRSLPEPWEHCRVDESERHRVKMIWQVITEAIWLTSQFCHSVEWLHRRKRDVRWLMSTFVLHECDSKVVWEWSAFATVHYCWSPSPEETSDRNSKNHPVRFSWKDSIARGNDWDNRIRRHSMRLTSNSENDSHMVNDDDDDGDGDGDREKNCLCSISSYSARYEMGICRHKFSPFTYSSNTIKCVAYFISLSFSLVLLAKEKRERRGLVKKAHWPTKSTDCLSTYCSFFPLSLFFRATMNDRVCSTTKDERDELVKGKEKSVIEWDDQVSAHA